MVRRVILPSLLLAGGVSMLIYGAAARRLPVWEEALVHEKVIEEREIEVPLVMPEPVLPDGVGPFSDMPGGVPGPIAPLFPNTVKKKVLVEVLVSGQTERVVEEPEYAVMREVTVGGLTLAAPGKLMRTYRRAEAGWDAADLPPPPSQCPT